MILFLLTKKTTFANECDQNKKLKQIHIMAKVLTKQFQYTGTDDFDDALDTQVNGYIEKGA